MMFTDFLILRIMYIQYWYIFVVFSTKVIATGGLKAAEAVGFINEHSYTIRHYNLMHVVLHVGFCDMMPKSLNHITQMMGVLGHVGEESMCRKNLPQTLFSEPLPHCIAHGQLDMDYTIWNKGWCYYNKWDQQVRFSLETRWVTCSWGLDHRWYTQ